MNILYYYTSNKFTVGGISVMVALKEKGHHVIFLSQDPPGRLHAELEKKDIPCFSSHDKKKRFLPGLISETLFICSFIKKHKTDIILAHLGACLPSVFAGIFLKARFFIFRHHTDEVKKYGNFKGRMGQWLINRLAAKIISPCQNVTNHLLSEGVNKRKIITIHYGYDFGLYPVPDAERVKQIRDQYKCRLLITVVARHVETKRHMLLLEVLDALINKQHLDIKCLLLDQGPLTAWLKSYVNTKGLEDKIFFIGYSDEVINYMNAADFIPHISESEASNSVIKEAGILSKIVAVCKGVGDFDDYIINDSNGFIFDTADTRSNLYNITEKIYRDIDQYQNLGMNLKKTVIQKFDIRYVISEYNQILES